MKSFFISYCTEDIAAAQVIYDYFSNLFRGKAEFFLSTLIEPGDTWRKTLKEEIKMADGALFLFTPRSLLNQWVSIEFGACWVKAKRIFPLITDEIKVEQMKPPISDLQVTTLWNSESVLRLIRKLANLCGCSVPVRPQVSQFCSALKKSKVCKAFPTLRSALRTLGLSNIPSSELLTNTKVETEPPNLLARVFADETLHVSGNVSETGLVIAAHCSDQPISHLILEAQKTESMRSFGNKQLVKLLIDQRPILPMFESQRHWADPQYILQQNGFFAYDLRAIQTERRFLLKLVFWRAEIEDVCFRFYLIRAE